MELEDGKVKLWHIKDASEFIPGWLGWGLVLIHSGKPLVGAENISRTLTNYRDAVQFVHDQTVQNMNKGLTPGEIIEVVELPPHLANDPYVQEYFGQVDRDIFQIFSQYMGWFTGNCRDLFPMSPTDEAQEMAELAGGVDQLAAKAQDALDEGKLEWALILADDVLLLNRTHARARAIKNATMISLAEETCNAQTRNYLLSEYLEETGQITIPIPAFSKIDENLVVYMPMDTLFGIMAVSLNSSKSLDKDIVVGLHLTDLTANYTLHVRRGILEVQPQIPDNPEFTVTAESLVWKKVVLGKLDPQEAVSDGDIVIADADPQEFYNFLALFNLPIAIFDTGAPANPYPSIMGTHNGTIKPNQTITVSQLCTYPCSGTGGHTEYIIIYNESGTIAEGYWEGYSRDWHNRTFDDPFTLEGYKTYNYTIKTGSYPQIIHERGFDAIGGKITCEEFIDANGKRYNDWIPAIRLE